MIRTRSALFSALCAALALSLVAGTGCYQTHIRTANPGRGVEAERRQWFLLWGLVPLSSPDGDECGPGGLAYADSSLSGTDILIDVGLQVAAGLVAAGVCPLPDNPTADQTRSYTACTAGVGALGGLLGSRTVNYRCAGGPMPTAIPGAPPPVYVLPPPGAPTMPAPPPPPSAPPAGTN